MDEGQDIRMRCNLKTGITSNIIFSKLDLSGYEYIKKAGFLYIDFNMQRGYFDAENVSFKLNEKNIVGIIGHHLEAIKNAGLEISQTHAPYYFSKYQLASRELFERYLNYVELSIYATALLKSRYIVLHPFFVLPWMEKYGIFNNEQLTKLCVKRLIKTAEKYDVYIAIENLPYDFCNDYLSHKDYINNMRSKRVVACLDIGHTFIPEDDTVKHIIEMTNLIKVLHIHDNDGKRDTHSRLRSNNRDWNMIVNVLKNINDDVVFSLETSGIYKKCDPDDIPNELIKDFNSVAELFAMNNISIN